MVWGCISCEGTGLITRMEGRMNGKDGFLSVSKLWPVLYIYVCVS